MSLDPREPPVVRPTIPFIGHLIGLATESSSYMSRLYRRHRFPICTLPMLNGKMYVVNSPGLIAAAAKNRDLSFTPFALEFSQNLLGIEPEHFKHFAADGWMDGMTQTIHASLSGEKLRSLKAACYRELAKTIRSEFPTGSEPVVIPHLYAWLLDRVPLAFTAALFGEKNPFDSEAIKNIWCVQPVLWIRGRQEGLTATTGFLTSRSPSWLRISSLGYLPPRPTQPG
jgi:hypothetical protein